MNKNMSFETALKKLEEVVAKLEAGEEPLEASMKLYEEGSVLAAFCNEKLQKAEQKMKQLQDFEHAGTTSNEESPLN